MVLVFVIFETDNYLSLLSINLLFVDEKERQGVRILSIH